MAGGKETPRQKMIGMMYLVLTALLALNISNAVLEKFAVLNNTLTELRHEATEFNEQTVTAILKASSTAASVTEAKKKAQEVREATNKVIADLDDYKAKLSQDHTGRTMPMDELILNTNISEEKMLSSTKPEFGKQFEKLLIDYSTRVREITKLNLPKLNRKAEDYEEFKNNEHHKTKDFLHFQFEGTPTMAAITTITQMQTEILENEAMALDTLAKIADAVNVKVDNLVPMVKPRSAVVAAGDKYVAEMFIAASSSGLVPEMYRNGQKLTVTEDPKTRIKMGKIEFLASAPSYDAQGQSKQTFKAEIKIKDSTYRETIEYTVIKPTIKITTGNRPQLFLNCGNLVNIEVPSLGTNYNPTFTAKGAKIVTGTKIGQVTIIPKEMKVDVTVINSGANLGTEQFDIKRIPRPHVTKKDQNGRDVDPKNGVKISGLTSLRVSVDPDESFKENVPKDAVYRIRNMEINLKRGANSVMTKTVTSEIVDLTDWKAQLRPGDIIVCSIKKVVRKTFLNEDDNVDFPEYVFIPLQ
jgi:gliding motility-associated protein GldM